MICKKIYMLFVKTIPIYILKLAHSIFTTYPNKNQYIPRQHKIDRLSALTKNLRLPVLKPRFFLHKNRQKITS